MKGNIHYFSQKDTIKRTVDPEKLGQRGRQANAFAELGLPILPGVVVDAEVAGHLANQDIQGNLKPFIRKIEDVVGKKYADPKNPLLFKIVISPNLAVSDYPTLHNFGLYRGNVAGFNTWVGALFGAHEVLFMVRGMLKVEERVAELEKRDKDRAKIREALETAEKTLNLEKFSDSSQAVIQAYEGLLPKGFFDDPWTQLDLAMKRVSRLIELDEQDAEDTAILIQPMVYGNYGKDSASGDFSPATS